MLSFKIMRIIGAMLAIFAVVMLLGIGRWEGGAKITKTAVEVSAEQENNDPRLEGKLVSTTGTLNVSKPLADNQYLKPGEYVVIERKVEMYAWVEGVKLPGTLVSNYRKNWVESPLSYKGHENPPKRIGNASVRVTEARVGIYDIDLSMIELPLSIPLQLNKNNLILGKEDVLVSKTYIFSGRGSIKKPQIGDLRIRYLVLPAGIKVTAFGKLSGKMIAPYLDQKNNCLYRLFRGTRKDAIASLLGGNRLVNWLVQILCFAAVMAGLWLVIRKEAK